MQVMRNTAAEITLTAAKNHSEPRDLLEVGAVFTAPDGSCRTVPAFWAGGDTWKVRYCSDQLGVHTWRSFCRGADDAGLSGVSGSLEVTPYTGENPLYLHGGSGKKQNSRYLTYADGTPFFWLADTWWMSLCDRISFPGEFGELVRDRVEKGFTAVQVIAGLYPDMHWYDPRGCNPAGYPWSEDFASLNPAYFDDAEQRIRMLIDNGLMPCIVGSWGYFMKLCGKAQLKRHWRNLIARFAAYPVAFCVAGEANMAFYDDDVDAQTHLANSRRDWNEIARYITDTDPFGRLLTIHPTQYGHEQIDDPTLLDLDMLQTGHGGYPSLAPTMQMMKKALARRQLPVIDSEVCYEGICGSSFSDVQRYAFLSCVFLGAAGHTYGANGIWQLNGITQSYGPSPHGAEWGKTSWREAAALPGSGQLGACKRYLTSFDWWKLEPHPEWVEDGCDGSAVQGHFAAGCGGDQVLVFKPNFGGSFWGDITVGGMIPGARYRFERFDPVLGRLHDTAEITADAQGKYRCPRVPIFQDWLYAFVKL